MPFSLLSLSSCSLLMLLLFSCSLLLKLFSCLITSHFINAFVKYLNMLFCDLNILYK